jgi:hypothetical protein
LKDSPIFTIITDNKIENVAWIKNKIFLSGAFEYLGPALGSLAYLSPQENNFLIEPVFPNLRGEIWDLCFLDSDYVIIAGKFWFLPSSKVLSIAKINIKSGEVVFSLTTDGSVTCVAYLRGKVYAGGDFFYVKNNYHPLFLILDAKTGDLAVEEPLPFMTFSCITRIKLFDDKIYLCGQFEIFWKDAKYQNLLVLDPDSGDILPYNFQPNSKIETIEILNNYLFCGGAFSYFTAPCRIACESLAVIELYSNTLIPFWEVDWRVSLLVSDGGDWLFIGGQFMNYGSNERWESCRNLLLYNQKTRETIALPTPIANDSDYNWRPTAALFLQDELWIAISIVQNYDCSPISPKGCLQGKVVKYCLRSFQLKEEHLNVLGTVTTMRVFEGKVWLGGNFSSVGGLKVYHFAHFKVEPFELLFTPKESSSLKRYKLHKYKDALLLCIIIYDANAKNIAVKICFYPGFKKLITMNFLFSPEAPPFINTYILPNQSELFIYGNFIEQDERQARGIVSINLENHCLSYYDEWLNHFERIKITAMAVCVSGIYLAGKFQKTNVVAQNVIKIEKNKKNSLIEKRIFFDDVEIEKIEVLNSFYLVLLIKKNNALGLSKFEILLTPLMSDCLTPSVGLPFAKNECGLNFTLVNNNLYVLFQTFSEDGETHKLQLHKISIAIVELKNNQLLLKSIFDIDNLVYSEIEQIDFFPLENKLFCLAGDFLLQNTEVYYQNLAIFSLSSS